MPDALHRLMQEKRHQRSYQELDSECPIIYLPDKTCHPFYDCTGALPLRREFMADTGNLSQDPCLGRSEALAETCYCVFLMVTLSDCHGTGYVYMFTPALGPWLETFLSGEGSGSRRNSQLVKTLRITDYKFLALSRCLREISHFL